MLFADGTPTPRDLERHGDVLQFYPPRLRLRVDRSVVADVLANIL